MINNGIPRDEPSTTGKIIITTTNGDLEIQLWAKQAPLACRNFIQLSLQGYYDNTIFHRMIPGFMIQGGDPTGTGTGGESIYGKPFQDQFHQRIKFTRRGIIAMANSGKDTNNSQFFITFGQCPHLNKKHTIFGKTVGDSIYNLLSFQSLQTNSEDRPENPPQIKKIRVALNPFDDIIPRMKPQAEKKNVQKKQQLQKAAKKSEIKKLKNKNKLTFEQEQQNFEAQRMKSSHDMLNDEKFSKKLAITQQQLDRKKKQKEDEREKMKQIVRKVNEVGQNTYASDNLDDILKNELLKKMKNAEGSINQSVQDEVLNYQKKVNQETGKVQIVWEDEKEQSDNQEGQNIKKLRLMQEQQYEALRTDELSFKKLKEGSAKEKRKQLVSEEKTLLSNVEKRKYEYLKKSLVQKRQGQVLLKLNKFTERLKADNPNDWMCHNLKFHIDSQNAYNFDKQNQQRKNRNDLDDGGLKVEYEKLKPQNQQINVEQLYELTAKDLEQQREVGNQN